MLKPTTILSIILLMLVSACKKNAEGPEAAIVNTDKPSNVFYVKTFPISISGLDDVVHVTGVIQSDSEAKPSFKTGGVIAKTYVEEGDHVRKGQLLAKLNATEIEAMTTQAKAALEKAQRDQQRAQNLYADSIATLEQLQNSITAVDVAKKSLQIAEFNLEYSEVRSPIDGKIITQLMHEGEITGPGIPVFYIMGVLRSDWKLVAGLTDKNWGRLRQGDKVKITIDAYPGWTIDGQVKRLSDVANPQSGTFDAEVSIPSKDKRIAAGMMAHMEIKPTAGSKYTMIPIEALVSSNGATGVVYVPKDGVAEKRTIQIQQFEGERIAVLSGLEGATEVITAGSGFLEDGDRISVEK
ncbi:MAG: efflux RND transporter periplasmic adaptor subunit [Saprospiraceae bacterium]|uniref:Efflux RND transporter periplasmic adaptor subunit n=1 Tax=Candidatus Opimibacter skivensis TaxID=2982028 RepID=A0A9D7XSR6_9BACT|nr:efflux RND transporter periplasmic adaptor subunit [Candidatus Opimibacter skivensis]